MCQSSERGHCLFCVHFASRTIHLPLLAVQQLSRTCRCSALIRLRKRNPQKLVFFKRGRGHRTPKAHNLLGCMCKLSTSARTTSWSLTLMMSLRLRNTRSSSNHGEKHWMMQLRITRRRNIVTAPVNLLSSSLLP